MKYQIRRSLFETNSSSVHVIAISSKICRRKDLPDFLRFTLGRYGQDVRSLDTVYERASYLYTTLLWLLEEGQIKKEEFDKNKMFIEYVLSKHNVRFEFDSPTGSDNKLSSSFWVDHPDRTILQKIIESEENLMNYLFSPLSVVVTGNDQSEEDIPDIECYDPDNYYLVLTK